MRLTTVSDNKGYVSFLEKFSGACHANRCFRYHKYYLALHEDNAKNFAIFFVMIALKIFELQLLLQKKLSAF